MADAEARSSARESKGGDRPGPDAIGTIVKRYRKRDKQYVFGLRVRAYGERHWVPLGTEREGWNDVRAADRRDEIVAMIRRGVWRPPNAFELDPREKDPGLHEFASDWLNRYRRTVRSRSAESAEYLLRRHLLPFLHEYRLSEIDYALLSSYVAKKLEQNEEIAAARDAGLILRDRHGRARRVLSPRTINMTLELLALILSDAVRRGLIPANPAADPELRLKAPRRRGNFLEADELLAVIDASGALDAKVGQGTLARAELARRLRADGRSWNGVAKELGVAESTAIWLAGRERPNQPPSVRRAIIATFGCAGLRNSELCELDLGDLDFAHGIIHVRDAKTEAGVRRVHMSPWLRDELLAYRASRPDAPPDQPAFPTRSGSRRNKDNINARVIVPAVRSANERRAEQRQPPLPDAVTAHTFRRTFITLMLEAGAPVPYVQDQVGHEDAKTTLVIYAQVLKRRDRRRHGEAFDALMTGAVPSAGVLVAPESFNQVHAVPQGSHHGNG
jgi:integrase